MSLAIDLYLGTFLVLCGFVLSLVNLKRLIKENNLLPKVLLSENLILICIGLAFITRFIHNMNPSDVTISDIQEKISNKYNSMHCGFPAVLTSYGPLIVSLVNSFLSLLIDNYMHYRILADAKKKENEDTVQEIGENLHNEETSCFRVTTFCKEYVSYIMIAGQWTIPIVLALSMYPVNTKEKVLSEVRDLDTLCMNMMDLRNDNCSYEALSDDLRISISTENYLEVYENLSNVGNTSDNIQSVLKNIYDIILNFNNDTVSFNVTSAPLIRKPKQFWKCRKVCYLENKKLLVYMFVLVMISFFVPITVSTIILTKIHVMAIKRPNIKTYVSRELLYNILFWSPVVLDTLMSIILCSYSMNGTRTSIFNVVANVYQAIKNFMNTKYFKGNTVNPIV